MSRSHNATNQRVRVGACYERSELLADTNPGRWLRKKRCNWSRVTSSLTLMRCVADGTLFVTGHDFLGHCVPKNSRPRLTCFGIVKTETSFRLAVRHGHEAVRVLNAKSINHEIDGFCVCLTARRTGLEPATSRVTGGCSNQLSYHRSYIWHPFQTSTGRLYMIFRSFKVNNHEVRSPLIHIE